VIALGYQIYFSVFKVFKMAIDFIAEFRLWLT